MSRIFNSKIRNLLYVNVNDSQLRRCVWNGYKFFNSKHEFRKNKEYSKPYSSNNTNAKNKKHMFFLSGVIGALGFYIVFEYKRKNFEWISEDIKKFRNNVNLFGVVNAAVPVGNVLAGRRDQFNFIADVAEKVAPTVVYIEIKDTRRFDFFTGKPMTASNGSGFIVKEDGLILTNAHVVINKPHSRVDVRLKDGREFTGVVETVDTVSDLATVRIPVKGLTALKLGSSSKLRPGEFVVALGSPLTLSNSVTAGVVSSAQRGSDELGLHNKMTYIQTDAAITFGNSGGPLVNLEGEAIGINSMKVTAGISFAIPSDYAKAFLARTPSTKPPDLTKGRRYMGITMLTLSPDIIMELRQRKQPVPEDVNHGVLVWKVILGSPAHSGGLQPGDIVTHVNGKPIRAAADIYEALADEHLKALDMTIIRTDGRRLNVSITPE